MKRAVCVIIIAFVCALVFAGGQSEPKVYVSNGFHYTVSGFNAHIVDYTGQATDVIIPDKLDGKKVVAIDRRRGEATGTGRTMVDTVVIYAYYGAFQDKGLTSVIIPDGVTTIERDAFRGNSLTSVIIPNSVKTLGAGAFEENRLTSVTISEKLTVIANNAFADNMLTSVVIPDSVKEIQFDAFINNRISSVTLGRNVTQIGSSAFSGSPLTNITLAQGNATFITKAPFLLSKDGKDLILYYGGERDVVIPYGVDRIDESAFAGNRLTSVVIPNSVTAVRASAFRGNELTSLVIPESVTRIEGDAFRANQLTSIVIPESVTTIGSRAFYHNPLASVTIGSNVSVNIDAFGSTFNDFYRGRERMGGTYIYDEESDSWSNL